MKFQALSAWVWPFPVGILARNVGGGLRTAQFPELGWFGCWERDFNPIFPQGGEDGMDQGPGIGSAAVLGDFMGFQHFPAWFK